jgi:hypothetical protein
MNRHDLERFAPRRRTFLKALTAGLGGLVTWRVSDPPLRSDAAGGQAVAAGGATTSAPPGYLTPQYVPDGYRLTGQYTDQPHGFRGGRSELVLIYTNQTNPLGYSRPLMVYQASAPQRRWLGASEQREGVAVTLMMRSGQRVKAEYYDGIWTLPPSGRPPLIWNTNDAHALTLHLGNLRVGLRASRMAGIDRDGLMHIASQLE